ncbi:hypothetical protein LXA52_17840, partial [Erwinia amylovora]|uniref:hypothetical protein n=1 Tax=Erwinia amylovora TaxID=552 RepID=UPI0020C10554
LLPAVTMCGAAAASRVLTVINRLPNGNKEAMLIFFSAKAIVCYLPTYIGRPVPKASSDVGTRLG